MSWWGWMVLGFVLLGSEMGFLDAAFFLVFLGLSALFVGILKLAGVAMPMWSEWVIFASLSLVNMVFFRKRLYTLVRGGAKGLADSMIGELITIGDGLQASSSGRVEYRGSTWMVRNGDDKAIGPGQEARIISVDGLVLTVTTGATNQENNNSN